MYNNDSGLQDKFIAYWLHVAKRFGKNKYVIGFDPLNEPTAAGMQKADSWQSVMFGGATDRRVLQPLFARIQKEAYQLVSNDSIMYFEHGVTDQGDFSLFDYVLKVFVVPVGYSKPPGGEIGSRNHALNSHSYCCAFTPVCNEKGEPKPESEYECQGIH